ncbi:AAA family ATPase [Paraburkholderia sp. UCT31]|nr:AAA family ATPase [Paraburkholderia sp. UCT31]
MLVGPNGSGKSTFLDAFRELVLTPNPRWTEESALVLPTGDCKAVMFMSSELDNLRLFAKRDHRGRLMPNGSMTGRELGVAMLQREMSHGQARYSEMQDVFKSDEFDVVVLDEPESALDLDGLGWLHREVRKTTKQVIIATHNPLLLSLEREHEGSVQVFGNDPDYAERIMAVYERVLTGRSFGKVEARLPRHAVSKRKPSTKPPRPLRPPKEVLDMVKHCKTV